MNVRSTIANLRHHLLILWLRVKWAWLVRQKPNYKRVHDDLLCRRIVRSEIDNAITLYTTCSERAWSERKPNDPLHLVTRCQAMAAEPPATYGYVIEEFMRQHPRLAFEFRYLSEDMFMIRVKMGRYRKYKISVPQYNKSDVSLKEKVS